MKLSNEEFLAIVEAGIANSQGLAGDDVSTERQRAQDYYNGDMGEYLPVAEGRSEAVSRDVLDTVESILPSVVKILTDEENALEFQPVGLEDEPAAQQETDAVRHIIFERDDAFINLYTFIKDALLSKNGVLKSGWEESDWQREEYKNLTQPELDQLLIEPRVEVELIDSNVEYDDETGESTYDVTLKTKRTDGSVAIYAVPPEEFGVSRDATSPNPKNANFVYQRTRKTASELIEDGFDRSVVETLPFDDNVSNDERYSKSDEQSFGGSSVNLATRSVWVVEAYTYIDQDDDGIAELHKVTAAQGGDHQSSLTMLDVEEVDSIPFVSATPVIRTHSYSGHSLADLVTDLQEIRTILLRSIIDNTLLTNNGRTAIDENTVDLDDMLSNRPGGVVRVDGQPATGIMPIPTPQLPQQAFGLLEYLEDAIKQRTGIGDEVQGLDTSALSNINTGVIMAALEQSRMRVELITRIIAETGLKELFKDVHELTQKNSTKELAIKLRNQWTMVNPSNWRNRTDIKVNVGIGRASKQHKLAMLDTTIQTQTMLIDKGATIADSQTLYNALADKAKLIGQDPAKYFKDPSQLPPAPPPPPDPNLILVQHQIEADKMRLQLEQQRFALEQFKAQSNIEVERERIQAEANSKVRAHELMVEKQRVDEQSQLKQADNDEVKAMLQDGLKRAEMAWKQQLEEQKLEMDKYKADIAALTQLVKVKNATATAEMKTIEYLEDNLNE